MPQLQAGQPAPGQHSPWFAVCVQVRMNQLSQAIQVSADGTRRRSAARPWLQAWSNRDASRLVDACQRELTSSRECRMHEGDLRPGLCAPATVFCVLAAGRPAGALPVHAAAAGARASRRAVGARLRRPVPQAEAWRGARGRPRKRALPGTLAAGRHRGRRRWRGRARRPSGAPRAQAARRGMAA